MRVVPRPSIHPYQALPPFSNSKRPHLTYRVGDPRQLRHKFSRAVLAFHEENDVVPVLQMQHRDRLRPVGNGDGVNVANGNGARAHLVLAEGVELDHIAVRQNNRAFLCFPLCGTGEKGELN